MDYITQYWTDMCYINNVEVSETVNKTQEAQGNFAPEMAERAPKYVLFLIGIIA